MAWARHGPPAWAAGMGGFAGGGIAGFAGFERYSPIGCQTVFISR